MVKDPLLELRNVTKIFRIGGGLGIAKRKVIKAVDNVSFALPGDKPNITALVGESGSGKSTIARLILGLIKPTSGQILYKGVDIQSILKKDWKRYRREVQAIFQDPYGAYNPFYRVDRIFHLIIKKFNLAQNNEEAHKLITRCLTDIGLRPTDILGRFPHQLSGGERQRLMLARILMLRPNLVVADEPVSMLDVSLRAMFLDSILKFKEKYGMSCLYITHDLNIAYYVADDVVILCYGRIVEKGDMETVLNEPLHPYTKLLVSSIATPDPTKRWKGRLELKVTSLRETRMAKRGCLFIDRCPNAMPICEKEPPPLISAKPGHDVACFLYQ